MSMILEALLSIFGCFLALIGIIVLVLMGCLMIKDIINDLKKWYKGDDWGWTESLEEYGYQKRYG